MIIAIPDIHGELEKLDSVLYQIDMAKVDRLIFLGDLVDRGPDSIGVMKRVKSLQETYPKKIIVLAGNHEWLMIDSIVKNTLDDNWLWKVNGGGYEVPEALIKWAASLPFYYEYKNFWFSHAPLPIDRVRRTKYGMALACGYSKQELIWTYFPDEEKMAKDLSPKIGICGHVHALRRGVTAPRFYKHYYFLDAGCGCSTIADLIAVDVKTKEMIRSS